MLLRLLLHLRVGEAAAHRIGTGTTRHTLPLSVAPSNSDASYSGHPWFRLLLLLLLLLIQPPAPARGSSAPVVVESEFGLCLRHGGNRIAPHHTPTAAAAAAAALLSPVVVLVVAVHETQARQMILRIARRLARVQCRLRGHAAAAPTPDASSDAPDGPWSAEIQQTRPDRAFLVHERVP